MKLARTRFVLIRNDDFDSGRRRRRATYLNTFHAAAWRRTNGGLTALWRVSPETGRPECFWSVEPAISDDQLRRARARRRRAAPCRRGHRC